MYICMYIYKYMHTFLKRNKKKYIWKLRKLNKIFLWNIVWTLFLLWVRGNYPCNSRCDISRIKYIKKKIVTDSRWYCYFILVCYDIMYIYIASINKNDEKKKKKCLYYTWINKITKTATATKFYGRLNNPFEQF